MSKAPKYCVLFDCIAIWDIKTAETLEEANKILERWKNLPVRHRNEREGWVYKLYEGEGDDV